MIRYEQALEVIRPDPRLEPEAQRAVILFADLVQSSDISVFSHGRTYYDILRGYQEVCLSVLVAHGYASLRPGRLAGLTYLTTMEGEVYYRVQGDELCLMLLLPRDAPYSEVADAIDRAVRVAADLKRRWLLDEKNLERLRGENPPFEVAVGIHWGNVHTAADIVSPMRKAPEGMCINMAKRVEYQARQGAHSRIVLSEGSFNALLTRQLHQRMAAQEPQKPEQSQGWEPDLLLRLRPPMHAELRGLTGRSRVYEIAALWDRQLPPDDHSIVAPLLDPSGQPLKEPMEACSQYYLATHWDMNMGCAAIIALQGESPWQWRCRRVFDKGIHDAYEDDHGPWQLHWPEKFPLELEYESLLQKKKQRMVTSERWWK